MLQISAVIILPMIWGSDGIWYSLVVAELMAVSVAATFVIAKRKKYKYL